MKRTIDGQVDVNAPTGISFTLAPLARIEFSKPDAMSSYDFAQAAGKKSSEPGPLESLAHGETESGLGLKIIQTPRIDGELL